MVTRRLEQHEGADNIGLDEGGGPIDRTVDMAFGRQMHHDIRAELLDERAHGRCVANINLLEPVASIFRHAGEIIEITRVGELVENADLVAGVLNEVTHNCGADETGPAGNGKTLGRHGALNVRIRKEMS